MRTVFADSFYFFALGNRNDLAHAKAWTFSQTYSGRLVTTGFVLTEFADGCSAPVHRRAAFLQTIKELRSNPNVTIVPLSEQVFQDGLQLFESRADKEWSLTDCISFVVMQQQGITAHPHRRSGVRPPAPGRPPARSPIWTERRCSKARP